MSTPSGRDDYDLFVRFYDLFDGARTDDLPMYRNFALATDGPILEVGCGTGRVLVQLAAEGHQVTGLDVSEAMLAVARARAASAGVADRVELVEGDMRDFDIPQRFGLACIPINTFMHCHDLGQQLACLRSIRRHLQPGGQLVVDIFHPDVQFLLESDGRLLIQTAPVDPTTGNRLQLTYARRLDLANQINRCTYIVDEIEPSGVVRRLYFPFRMRYVHRYEMELLLRLAGFSLESVYGSYDLEPFGSDSDKMIFAARTDR